MAISPRVLLADPDTTLARTLAWMLKQNGYVVSTAGTLENVEAVLGAEPIDIMLLDIALLGERPTALASLKLVRKPPPALLCTALSMPSPALADRLGLNANAIIRKPFQVRDLLERMRQSLRAQRHGATDSPYVETGVQRDIAEIFSDISALTTFDDVCRALVRGVARALKVPRCSVILAQPGAAEGIVIAASDNPVLRQLPVNLERYPEIRRALDTDGPVLVSDVATDPLFDTIRSQWDEATAPMQTLSAIAMRFRLNSARTGVFFIRTSDPGIPLSLSDVTFAQRVLVAAVSALEEASAREAMQSQSGGK